MENMKMNISKSLSPLYIFAIFLVFFHSSVYSNSKKCKFTYNPSDTKLEWTAYKFTEKSPVSGTFNEIRVTNHKKKSPSILSAMDKARFTISTQSIDSGVPDRDQKIRSYFFGSSGKAKILSGFFSIPPKSNPEKGKADLVLTFNGIRQTIPVDYSIQGNVLEVIGNLDVANFGMLPGIQKLNEVCHELHIGKDGVSKLWSEVSFRITSKFTEICN